MAAPKTAVRRVARKHIVLLVVLLTVAAAAGAVVLTPSRGSKPDAWDAMRERVSKRAQVDLFEDFSMGLDAWKSSKNVPSTWSYDKNGFVNPRTLSLFQPTVGLTNYNLDAVVQIESKGLGVAFRAASTQNYQAVQLIAEGSGPMPSLRIERYTVIAGRATHPVRVRYPERFQPDTLYRVHLQVEGDGFSLYIQGRLVDYWSDARLATGGIGLFCSPGERARIASVRVFHNVDSLGHACSLLASVL